MLRPFRGFLQNNHHAMKVIRSKAGTPTVCELDLDMQDLKIHAQIDPYEATVQRFAVCGTVDGDHRVYVLSNHETRESAAEWIDLYLRRQGPVETKAMPVREANRRTRADRCGVSCQPAYQPFKLEDRIQARSASE